MHARPTHPTGIPGQSRQSWLRWHITWSVAIVTGLGLALLIPATVQARTFQCRAGDVACLITSIKQANAQPGPQHEIRLEGGTYTLTAVENETNGPNGLPLVTSTLVIRGTGSETTVIERQASAPPFRLLHVAATGSLTLDSLSLRGGGVFSSFSFLPFGGGLLNDAGTVTMTGSALIDNFSVAGGGLYNRGGMLTIKDSILQHNRVGGGNGSAGGGLYNEGGTVSIINSSVVENTASHFDSSAGGGLGSAGGTVTILNSAIADNAAAGPGGGLALGRSVRLTLINSTVAGNVACGGGPGSLGGGGLFVGVGGGMVALTNSTIADNSTCNIPSGGFGSNGGGLHVFSGSVQLQNTLLARNTSSFGPGADCSGPLTSQGNNLIGDVTGCSITLLPNDLTGESGLGAFTDDGLPGEGYVPLVSTSRAINAGNPVACPKTDQLGEKRVGICDIGAIEFQGTAVSSQ